MFLILILLFFFINVNSYLNNYQWSLIRSIIINSNPENIKVKTKQIIFNEYYLMNIIIGRENKHTNLLKIIQR